MNTTPLDEAQIDRMLDQITTTVTKRERVRTLRHRTVAITSAVVLLLSGTGGALAIAQATPTMKNVAECYSAADMNSRHTSAVLVAPNGQAAPNPTDAEQRARMGEELCGAVWRIGQLETDPNAADTGRQFPVPTLVACTLPDGRFGYFPTDEAANDTCSRLGLALIAD
jgi:hypothetical protein